MVRSRVSFSVPKSHMRSKAKPPSRLDTGKIKVNKTKAELEEEMSKALRD